MNHVSHRRTSSCEEGTATSCGCEGSSVRRARPESSLHCLVSTHSSRMTDSRQHSSSGDRQGLSCFFDASRRVSCSPRRLSCAHFSRPRCGSCRRSRTRALPRGFLQSSTGPRPLSSGYSCLSVRRCPIRKRSRRCGLSRASTSRSSVQRPRGTTPSCTRSRRARLTWGSSGRPSTCSLSRRRSCRCPSRTWPPPSTASRSCMYLAYKPSTCLASQRCLLSMPAWPPRSRRCSRTETPRSSPISARPPPWSRAPSSGRSSPSRRRQQARP
mmetsp:Transcript_51160/g.109318  ORF Transcript_51160/g.109318 Transcript_51160/m.109318 type:complete len:270 (-) Transcript_51160:617-1426(-)